MAWDVSLSGFLLCMGAIKLYYNSSSGLVDENVGDSRRGFAIAAGAAGFYLRARWIQIAKKAIRSVSPVFNVCRMMKEHMRANVPTLQGAAINRNYIKKKDGLVYA